ncbi:MAG: Ig-like domain-containing protein [Eubacterium sp.]|nr:Ig-like domain-containing protein [Eubacterium sp.]
MSVKTVQAVINGQTYTLTKNTSTGKYEATITAPSKSSYTLSGHYYPVTVKATDDAGNVTTKDATDSTLGASLRLQVKEKVVPVITITAPTASQYLANSTPAIAWKITDDDSGVNPSTIALKVDGTAVDTSKITKTAVTGGYTCSYTPASALSDGAHTVVATASDYDGNAAEQKSVTFTVDTIPPTLSISAPTEEFITNKSTLTVKGTTDDETSKPVAITVNGVPIPVTNSGTFSKDVTLKEGSNTITIVAKDKAGKTTTVTRTVKLDTAPPVIKSATITPNPVDCGKTFVISVEVTD